MLKDDFLRKAALELTEKVNIDRREKRARPSPNWICYAQRALSMEESGFSRPADGFSMLEENGCMGQ